jgi:subtilisin-like proprotein convertase family protein
MYAPRRALLSGALMLFAAAGQASADVNPTPIAVPLLGDQGAGSPYPSRIHVTARGGVTQKSVFGVILHGVTHPCPEDLAVLLVHGSLKYLLMSHAGGCRPAQGTDILFSPSDNLDPIPDNDLTPAPLPQLIQVKPSNYGSTPTFPAPAPAGPYTGDLTSGAVSIDGDWDLYVIDTVTGHRGVISGGWSLHYDGHVKVPLTQTSALPIAIPATGSANQQGPAGVYPITFDLSSVPAGVKASGDVMLEVTVSHAHPGDLRLVLQAPSGDAVLLMANAGTAAPITNVRLDFLDAATGYLPSASQLTTGLYKPTAYGPTGPLPAPAPQGPYGPTLNTFYGQELRGIWKLWIADAGTTSTGTLGDANLNIGYQRKPTFVVLQPTTGTQFTANTPFLHIVAKIDNAAFDQPSATWYTTVSGKYYQSGAFTYNPGSDVVTADIPLKRGMNPTNFLQFYVYNTSGEYEMHTIDVSLNEFVYTLSEGATGGFFDLDETLANPTGADAPVTISFLPEHSAPIPFTTRVDANGQTQLHVNDLVPGDAVSTIVHSTAAIPLAIERTMSWDKTGYGGSGGTAIQPNTHWLFAEGSQGYFDTYVLLANDGDVAANTTMTFLVEGGAPVTLPVVVAAHTRKTIYGGDVPAIVNTSFGIDITADQPITAERSMYFPHDGPRLWEGGHEAAGATATSTRWFFAEGATGPFFECFILLSNPTNTPATTQLTYLLPSGETVPHTVTVPAHGRTTIDVETVDPKLANAAVSTTITSDVGIVAERSMYWPDLAIGWREAHNSVGVTDAALRWAVSDGRNGGERGYQTYVLLANPNPVKAEVQVRFLKTGAAPVTKTYTLAPTSRLNIDPGETTSLIGEGVFSADVQVLNFQPIVVEKALYWNAGGEIWAAGTGTVGTPIPPPE